MLVHNQGKCLVLWLRILHVSMWSSFTVLVLLSRLRFGSDKDKIITRRRRHQEDHTRTLLVVLVGDPWVIFTCKDVDTLVFGPPPWSLHKIVRRTFVLYPFHFSLTLPSSVFSPPTYHSFSSKLNPPIRNPSTSLCSNLLERFTLFTLVFISPSFLPDTNPLPLCSYNHGSRTFLSHPLPNRLSRLHTFLKDKIRHRWPSPVPKIWTRKRKSRDRLGSHRGFGSECQMCPNRGGSSWFL